MRFLTTLFAASVMILMFTSKSPAVDLLYVSMGNNTIVSYDTTGNSGATIATTESIFASTNLNGPRGLTFDSSGNLYAANNSGSTISKFNSAGVYQSHITSNLSGPWDIAIDSLGNLYASNNGDSTISKYNSGGSYQSKITSFVSGPFDLAFDSSGNLYVVNNDNTIKKYNSAGIYQSYFFSAFTTTSLAFDSAGDIYTSNYVSSFISKYNASGIFQSSISSYIYYPSDIAIDSAGNLYAANAGNNTISKYDSGGNFITFWSTVTNPRGLAFKPMTVPEPSTYTLATIAAGVMACMARRRK